MQARTRHGGEQRVHVDNVALLGVAGLGVIQKRPQHALRTQDEYDGDIEGRFVEVACVPRAWSAFSRTAPDWPKRGNRSHDTTQTLSAKRLKATLPRQTSSFVARLVRNHSPMHISTNCQLHRERRTWNR